jgi:hypothetical protein
VGERQGKGAEEDEEEEEELRSGDNKAAAPARAKQRSNALIERKVFHQEEGRGVSCALILAAARRALRRRGGFCLLVGAFILPPRSQLPV